MSTRVYGADAALVIVLEGRPDLGHVLRVWKANALESKDYLFAIPLLRCAIPRRPAQQCLVGLLGIQKTVVGSADSQVVS
jgi:hypothetical protein